MNNAQIKHACRVLNQIATLLVLVVGLKNLYLFETDGSLEIGLLVGALAAFTLAQVVIFKLLGRVDDDKPEAGGLVG